MKPAAPDEQRGIYLKYRVERLNDPTGKHRDCLYFVLDERHDKFAGPALRAYADACEAEFPLLARDLRERHGLPCAAVAKASPPMAPVTGDRLLASLACHIDHDEPPGLAARELATVVMELLDGADGAEAVMLAAKLRLLVVQRKARA